MSQARTTIKAKVGLALRHFARVSDFIKPNVAYLALLVGLAGFGYTGYSNHQSYLRLQDTFCGFTSSVGEITTTQIPLQTAGGKDLAARIGKIGETARDSNEKLKCTPPSPSIPPKP